MIKCISAWLQNHNTGHTHTPSDSVGAAGMWNKKGKKTICTDLKEPHPGPCCCYLVEGLSCLPRNKHLLLIRSCRALGWKLQGKRETKPMKWHEEKDNWWNCRRGDRSETTAVTQSLIVLGFTYTGYLILQETTLWIKLFPISTKQNRRAVIRRWLSHSW